MKYSVIIAAGCLWLLVGCGPQQQDAVETPGPVTESDKYRYNLNPNDELRYDNLDSTERDTVVKDSLLQN